MIGKKWAASLVAMSVLGVGCAALASTDTAAVTAAAVKAGPYCTQSSAFKDVNSVRGWNYGPSCHYYYYTPYGNTDTPAVTGQTVAFIKPAARARARMVRVPDVVNNENTRFDATSALDKLGFNVIEVLDTSANANNEVDHQYPAAGTMVPYGSTVLLYGASN